ncbi:MAG: 50S ribosomal protein L19 [Candidatus Omnitrophica bacterium CG1_02_44_16]|nr:MAG: 50S ribosomal protein L19 [Candidatus Omnitrophica bacterium CG1_02_44_16]PIY84011.1 MAG: 50S ribosomal protein L19 [Candidatus Omnitrophica bacterium CG_4_10_14_0_8_um_filter_44_12]PIZ84955.1 MAG: 50S ribosomal protein L19 [Candidatus Omnitrophica bacterium CG_4_10_14_0_2_um_filter_44_9]
MDKIKLVEGLFLRKDLPVFGVGDTVKVLVKIPEGDKVRIHPFEGMVIETRGEGISTTFTVRKVSYGEGVERVFPFHSPGIDSIEILKKGKVKSARLYYLRHRKGRAAKVEERVIPVADAAAPAEEHK